MKILRTIALASVSVASLATLSLSANAKTLVYCSEASPEGFDPAAYTTGTTFDASAHTVYNGLVDFKKGTTEVIPALAESWDISPDGLEYTFHLRKGVHFHKTSYFSPSRDFNADDVVFSIERQWKKDHPWYSYAPGLSWQYFNSMGFGKLLKDVKKVDDHTVKITLNQPEAPFLADLAMNFISIMSKEYADKLQADGKMVELNAKPVGTGPFIFVSYQKDAVIRYKANPDYFEGKQPLDNLVFAITTDPSVRAQKLKAGECQVISNPAPADVAGLKANPDLVVKEQPGLNVAYLAYNTLQPPFDKVEVRQALNMAINKKTILEAVYEGAGTPAKTPIPPTMWSYNKSIEEDNYNPEAAKTLLDKAGVKDLKMKIWAMPVSRPYMPNARRAAELMQADLGKIGVKVEIATMEWGEYVKQLREKKRDGAVIMGWTGDNGDPDNFLSVLASCASIGSNNYANWCYEPFDKIISEAKKSADHEKRIELYEQAQAIFKQQAPWFVIANSTVAMPMSKKVKNYVIDPVGAHRFVNVDIDE